MPNLSGAVTVLDRLLAEAIERPDAVAVWDGVAALDYGGLLEQAWELANRLAALGVGVGDRVVVSMRPSVERVVATVAIGLSGAACVPLEQNAASARTRRMLAVADAAATISDGPPADPQISASQRTGGGDTRLPRPEDAAYLIFTSGTSGPPKGVLIAHAALDHLIDYTARELVPGPGTGVAQIASFGFDAAVWEVWAALATGGRLCVCPDWDVRVTPFLLQDWLERSAVGLCLVTTPLAQEMFELNWLAETTLRTMLVGGDLLTQHPPTLPFEVRNAYGPTEATVFATVAVLDSADSSDNVPPPIGGPIGQTMVRIQREDGSVTVGEETGELFLGGPGLAIGYLGEPELTMRRFVRPDGRDGQRWYRTGDLVSRRPDGQLQFRGRFDDQVKVRGVRIELAEVEAAVAGFPSVRAVACRAWVGPSGDARLVVYVVSTELDRGALSRHLRAELPTAAVPSEIITLQRLPTTTTGKLDRALLPRPSWAVAAGARATK